jgi:hydroxymethylglutaryl-CoA lyase
MNFPASVEIVEVGLRDGLQSEDTSLPTPEEIGLIETLTRAGIKRFEATPFVSPKAIPQLADAEGVLAALPKENGVIYGGLIPNERGYERAKAAGAREVVLVGALTEGYCRANLNRSVDEVLDGFAPIAARRRGRQPRADQHLHRLRRSLRGQDRSRAGAPRRREGRRERHRGHNPLRYHRRG